MSARRLTTRIALLTTIAGLSIGMPTALAQNARNENAAAGRNAAAAEARRDVLPIREITLYRSGVASFQRRGLVTDDSRIRLRFNVDQINDVLKSMVVLDLSGEGRVDAVSYGSKDPLSRRLSSFAVDVSDEPSLAQLLSRLRGTRILVDTGDGKVQGVILGVEMRQKASADTTVTVPVVQLSTGTGIRTIDLSTSNDIEILDERVKAELTRALEALAEHRADREKDVELVLQGEGEREIVVAYVQESPVWKTSYRLVLPDDAKDDTILQGWAIVENTTDEDWTDVRLSLVSGRPVSFTMDLYEPLYMERPEVAVPTIAGVTPRVYEWADEGGGGGQSPFQENERAEFKSRDRSAGRPMAPGAAPAPTRGATRELAEADAMVSLGAALQRAQAAAATGVDVGEVFQYRLDHPVTVERQRSAMIPIISSGVEAKRVSIFTVSEGQEHPMRGVRLTNSQSLQLMPGPIAVFDGDSYAGDAQIAHMSAGETRLLAYSVDLDVEHRQEGGQTQIVQKVRIVDGMVEMRLQRENRVKHIFNNKDTSRGRTIIVEQPRLGGWDLVEPAKPLEVNDQLYRFEVEVGSGKENAVEILQRVTDFSRVGVLDMNIDTLLMYARQGKASDAVVEAVRKAAGMQQTVREIEREIQRLENERSEITRDQDRIRQNMQTIDRNSDLYRRYMTKLTEQETRVEQIATSIKQKQEELNEARRELSEYVAGLKVE